MIGKFSTYFFSCLATLVLTLNISLCLAQDILVNLEPEQGSADESFILSFNIKNAKEIKTPKIKQSKEFIINSTGTTNSTSYLNGAVSKEVSFAFTLSPRAGLPPGEYTTPEGEIAINGAKVALPRKKITISSSSPNINKIAKEIKINQFTDKEIAYVGEQITYTVQIISNRKFLGGSINDIIIDGFWREKLKNNEKKVFQAGRNTITTFQEALIPNKSGELEIPSRLVRAKLASNINTRRNNSPFFNDRFFSNFFNTRTITKEFSTKAIKVKVKELPKNQIKGYVPVGQLDMKSSLDKNFLKQGQSLNMTLSLNGFANLRPLKLKKPKTDKFKIYIEEGKTNTSYKKGRVRFNKIFKISMIPTISGKHDIPLFEIDYFDPFDEKFKKLVSTKEKIQVLGNFDERTELPNLLEEQEDEDLKEENLNISEILKNKKGFKINPYYSIFLILLALCFRFIKNKNQTTNSEKTSALELANKEIENGKDLTKVFKSYLNKKTNKNYNSKTIKEINIELIENKIIEKDIVNKNPLLQIEEMKYQGDKDKTAKIDLSEISESLKKYLNLIDTKLLVLFFVLLSTTHCNSYSKEEKTLAIQAEKHFQDRDFENAILDYKRLSETIKNSKVYSKIAKSHLENKEVGKAIYFYKLASTFDKECCKIELEEIRKEFKQKPLLLNKNSLFNNNINSMFLFSSALFLSALLIIKDSIKTNYYFAGIIISSFLVIYLFSANYCSSYSLYGIERCLISKERLKKTEVIITNKGTIAYSKADYNSQAIKKLRDGTELLALDSIDKWTLVDLGKNRTGWIENNSLLISDEN